MISVSKIFRPFLSFSFNPMFEDFWGLWSGPDWEVVLIFFSTWFQLLVICNKKELEWTHACKHSLSSILYVKTFFWFYVAATYNILSSSEPIRIPVKSKNSFCMIWGKCALWLSFWNENLEWVEGPTQPHQHTSLDERVRFVLEQWRWSRAWSQQDGLFQTKHLSDLSGECMCSFGLLIHLLPSQNTHPNILIYVNIIKILMHFDSFSALLQIMYTNCKMATKAHSKTFS